MEDFYEPSMVSVVLPHIRFVNGPGEAYQIFINEELKFVMTGNLGCILDGVDWIALGVEIIRALARDFDMKMQDLRASLLVAPSIGFQDYDDADFNSDIVVRDTGTPES